MSLKEVAVFKGGGGCGVDNLWLDWTHTHTATAGQDNYDKILQIGFNPFHKFSFLSLKH